MKTCAVLFVLFALGCGSSPTHLDAGALGSCLCTTGGIIASCYDYTAGDQVTLIQNCNANTTLSCVYSTTTTCPSNNRIGRCTYTVNGTEETQSFYSPAFEGDPDTYCTGSLQGVFTQD